MKIALLGDIALFGRYSTANPEIFAYLGKIREYLSTFDHVVGNLETPFCDGARPALGKSAWIFSQPENVAILEFLGVDIVNLANNHMFDYGLPGLLSTVELLEERGIRYFGLDGQSLVVRSSSSALALHGYCSYNTNPLGMARPGRRGVTPLNVARVADTVKRHHDDGYLNLVSVHSGQEHVNYPSLDDIRMARMLAGLCPYIYHGHHPHVAQGVETDRGSLIAYSLGNFLFDDVYTTKSKEPLLRQTSNNKTGLILEVDLGGRGIVDHRESVVVMGERELTVMPREDCRQVDQYSRALYDDPETYSRRRRDLVDSFLRQRKSRRDLMWYLKRLNLNSVAIILNARLNSRRYRQNVVRFL